MELIAPISNGSWGSTRPRAIDIDLQKGEDYKPMLMLLQIMN